MLHRLHQFKTINSSIIKSYTPDEDSSPTPGQADLVDVQPEVDSEFSLRDQIDELSVHSFLLVLAQSVSHSASAFGRFSNLHLARRDIVLAASSLDVYTRTSLRGLPVSKHALFGPAVSSAIKDCAERQRDSLSLNIMINNNNR